MSCLKCGSNKVTEKVEAIAGDNIPAEVLFICTDCGEWLNFFAYGNWEDPKGPKFNITGLRR